MTRAKVHKVADGWFVDIHGKVWTFCTNYVRAENATGDEKLVTCMHCRSLAARKRRAKR